MKTFCIFTGEIDRIDPLLKRGYTDRFSSVLLSVYLNSVIMPKRINYQDGETIGNLTYVKEAGYDDYKNRYAIFICPICGDEFKSRIVDVKFRDVESCGCLNRQRIIDKVMTHGLSSSKVFWIWHRAKQRCYNQNDKEYKNYGSRGIKMQDNWINDVSAFYDYVTTLEGYDESKLGCGKDELTIDRENNDLGYIEGNLRWADKITQNNNRRCSKKYRDGNRN